MMIYTITENEFKRMGVVEQGLKVFYEDEFKIEMYIHKVGINATFKHVHMKDLEDDKADLIWKDQHLTDKFMRVIAVEKPKQHFSINIAQED